MTEHQRRVAQEIADLMVLEPIDEAALIIAEALRLKADRSLAQRMREQRQDSRDQARLR